MEPNENRITGVVVDSAYRIHSELGPGMLESAYESVLAYELVKRGLGVRLQVPVPLLWDGLMVKECFRADMVVEGIVLRVGLLLNFGAKTFADCVQRLVNGL